MKKRKTIATSHPHLRQRQDNGLMYTNSTPEFLQDKNSALGNLETCITCRVYLFVMYLPKLKMFYINVYLNGFNLILFNSCEIIQKSHSKLTVNISSYISIQFRIPLEFTEV